jgi:seryl-tRNA synthetase
MIEQVSAIKRKIKSGQAEVERLQAIHADLAEQAAARSAERDALESELAQVNEQLQAIELDRLVGRKVDEKVASKASGLAEELKGRIAAVDMAPAKNSAAVAGLIDQEKAALKKLGEELAAAQVEHFHQLAREEATVYAGLLRQVEESIARLGALHQLSGKGFVFKDTDAFLAPRLHMDGEKVAADCFAVADNVHQFGGGIHGFVQFRDAARAAEAAFKAQIDAA